MTLTWRYAARSDVGLLRDGNEDAAYAGTRLFAVADGMGGHAAGEVASAAAIAALEQLDHRDGLAAPAEALREAVRAANDTLRDMAAADVELHGMGTTVTAVYADGDQTWLAHIGDSRAYLLRDGELRQLTRDHTFVQQLVDEGRLRADEASSHPQRSLLTRALDGREPVDLDLDPYTFLPGDRLLLCTDGLSGVVSDESLADVLANAGDPEQAVQRLVDLALRGGGPDNVTCIVADAYERPGDHDTVLEPVVAGAAQPDADPGLEAVEDTPAARAAALAAAASATAASTTAVPAPPRAPDPGKDSRRRSRRLRRRRALIAGLVAVAVLALGAGAGWTWVRSQYYVGTDGTEVVVYRGVEGSLGPVTLSTVAEQPGLRLDALPPYEQQRVRDGIHANGRAHARTIVDRLRDQAAAVTGPRVPSPSPSPPVGPAATASP